MSILGRGRGGSGTRRIFSRTGPQGQRSLLDHTPLPLSGLRGSRLWADSQLASFSAAWKRSSGRVVSEASGSCVPPAHSALSLSSLTSFSVCSSFSHSLCGPGSKGFLFTFMAPGNNNHRGDRGRLIGPLDILCAFKIDLLWHTWFLRVVRLISVSSMRSAFNRLVKLSCHRTARFLPSSLNCQ